MCFSLLIHLLTALTMSAAFEKCCNFDHYLTETNSTLRCEPDSDKRTQIYTHPLKTNFSLASNRSECVDFTKNGSIVKYHLSNRKLLDAEPFLANYYHKCCPLNHFYHSTTKSCVESSLNHTFLTLHFLKIGLPHCRIIADYKLYNLSYRFEIGILHLNNRKYFEGQFCLDKDERDKMIARVCEEDKVCDRVRCLHKCCPDGQSFVGGKKCVNTYRHGFDLGFTNRVRNASEPFALIHRYDCKIYILNESHHYFVDLDGVFWAFYNRTNSLKPHQINEKSYCIEHTKAQTKTKRLDQFLFFMCFTEDAIPMKILVTRWIKIVSCLFIAMTIVVYLSLAEMRNLFGRILLSYCFATLMLFIVLIYNQFNTSVSDRFCAVSSFVSVYLSLAVFTWLNVMCFNIWWTFGSNKIIITAKQKQKNLKKFGLYSLYGWGLPSCLTLLVYLAYVSDGTPHAIKPYLGVYKCFWENRGGNYGMFLYQTFPLTVFEATNLVLFVKTITYCLKVKTEINNLNDNRLREKNFKYDKEQLQLILKLSVTMGISFVFEVVSSFYVFSNHPITKYIEIVWDSFNCGQGVFIFVIFVCKRRVVALCMKRTQIFKPRTKTIRKCVTEEESLKT